MMTGHMHAGFLFWEVPVQVKVILYTIMKLMEKIIQK